MAGLMLMTENLSCGDKMMLSRGRPRVCLVSTVLAEISLRGRWKEFILSLNTFIPEDLGILQPYMLLDIGYCALSFHPHMLSLQDPSLPV